MLGWENRNLRKLTSGFYWVELSFLESLNLMQQLNAISYDEPIYDG